MPHAQHPESVRQRILETFKQLGADQSATLREMILIRDGYYCGRRFECDGLQAILFFEEDQIKFHNREGGVMRVCTPADLLPKQTRQVA